MAINYINRQLSDEEFFAKVFNKGKSKSSENLTRAAISNLQYFTANKYQKTKEVVLQDLKKEYDSSKETTLVLRFLQDFIDWLDEDHCGVRYLYAFRMTSKEDQFYARILRLFEVMLEESGVI